MTAAYGAAVQWQPQKPRFRPLQLALSWALSAASLYVAAALVPGVSIGAFGGALLVAALIAVLNAVLPPVVAALRLPLTLALGFVAVLLVDALLLELASDALPNYIGVDSLADALLAALVMAVVSLVLQVMTGANDEDAYSLRVVQRVARRQGTLAHTDEPGILFLEIDGLALPVLRDAVRDGSAPTMARWLAEERLSPDRVGARPLIADRCQPGGHPAWLKRRHPRLPLGGQGERNPDLLLGAEDCAEIERQHSSGVGLLVDGGASRGNLLSGEAEEVILTVSRMAEERKANPGYRAFLANGFNVTRALVLFGWEVLLEWTAAIRSARRDIRPRGHRGGIYPFLRATMCVVVRDLIVYGVLTDMMRGRSAVYATFSSYDEVAHHSGLQRADTMEALRKLDQQLDRIARARRFAPRPYEIVVLSDHGQTQGATFKQRNGHSLEQLVERSIGGGDVAGYAGGDEQSAMVGHAAKEATGRAAEKRPKNDVSDREVVVLGSGNLGLIYLMEEKRRLTREEIDERHPKLIPALREHPHIGWLLVRSSEHGAVVLGASGAHYLESGRVEGEDPLTPYSATAPQHILRTDGFSNVADIMIGSLYDPELDEGCAFEELISFHGGLGGPQTRPFILSAERLPLPAEPIVGAAAVHRLLSGWRKELHGTA